MEMYGLCRVLLNNDMKICKIEAFFDPDSFLHALEGKLGPQDLSSGQCLLGDITKTAVEKATCPVKHL
jgi:hypothetical protein